MTSHWTEKYLYKPYIEGEYDCASLFCEVQHFECGKQVPDYGAHSGLRSQKYDLLRSELAANAVPLDEPKEYCGVVLRTGNLWHIGVYTQLNGEPHVLHNVKGKGVKITPLRMMLPLTGYRCEEYLEWI